MLEQIRAELQHHNIRVYPFDTEDADPEEVQLNEAIRVSADFASVLSLSDQLALVEHDPLRCRWLGKKCYHRWSTCSRTKEPMGCHQC